MLMVFKQHLLLDLEALITKTLHSYHIVGLVKDKDFDLAWLQQASPDKVHGSTGSADDNLRIDALVFAGSIHRNAGSYVDVVKELTHDLEDPHDLPSKFTSRSEDQNLRPGLACEIGTHKGVENKGSRLACT